MSEQTSILLGLRLDSTLADMGEDLAVDLRVLSDPCIVLGAPGSGKTTLGLHLFWRAAEAGRGRSGDRHVR